MVVPAGFRETVLCPGPREVVFPEPRCRPIPGGWDWIEIGEGDAGIVVACANLQATHREVRSLFEYLRSPLVENVAHEAAFKDAFQLTADRVGVSQGRHTCVGRHLDETMPDCPPATLRRRRRLPSAVARRA